jgi:hypothetical protein
LKTKSYQLSLFYYTTQPQFYLKTKNMEISSSSSSSLSPSLCFLKPSSTSYFLPKLTTFFSIISNILWLSKSFAGLELTIHSLTQKLGTWWPSISLLAQLPLFSDAPWLTKPWSWTMLILVTANMFSLLAEWVPS